MRLLLDYLFSPAERQQAGHQIVPARPSALRRLSFVLVGAASAAILAAMSGCDGELIADTSCPEIPAGGCPTAPGVDVCADPLCASKWVCERTATQPDGHNGRWVAAGTCAPRDAGPDSSRDATDTSVDGTIPNPFDGSLPDGAGGGPGCPALEVPDCALAVGATCPGECEDLFVCQEGAWNYWGSCVNGVLTPE